MSEHEKHFVGPIAVPEFGCVECSAGQGPGPIDWPARFRAAAAVAEGRYLCGQLQVSAYYLESTPPHVVEAIGRALLGEDR